jgi:sec-independent protein translocase protein TatB
MPSCTCAFVSALRGKVSWSFMGIHPTIEAATLSMWDTMIVMIMALVVFGPRRLPKIGRQIGKLMYEFRKASNDFRFQMEEELRNAEEADRRQREEAERQRALAATSAAPPAQITASAQPDGADGGHYEDYAKTGEPDGPASYDEAAFEHYEHYRNEAPVSETEIEPEPESPRLRVQPPETGAPVPAERPTSRATATPAEQTEPPFAEPAAAETGPSGDEAAVSHPEAFSAHDPAPENPPASEAGAETEPASHHG